MSFKLKQFEIGPMQNFAYVIGDEKSKEALIVDPAWQPDTLIKKVEEDGFKLAGMIVTHAHYDHTNAIEALLQKLDIPVYTNAKEIEYSKSGTSIVSSLGDTAKAMEGESSIQLGDTKVTFLHTPGHTPGSQCIQVGNKLITGDTLFIGGCGRSDLPGGDPRLLYKTLKKISDMPSDLEIMPGHDYGYVDSRTLEEEKEENPYLSMKSEEQFLKTVS